MDFRLSEDQAALRDAAREFAQGELIEAAKCCEKTGAPPPKPLIQRFAELGFLGVNIPESYGGLGLGNLEALIILEEFAKISSAVAFPIFESCVGPVKAIERFGSDTLKSRILPSVCNGNCVVAIAMSEPDAGSALTDLKTRAIEKSGKILLNGVKRWCSGGGHADGYLVYCRFSDEPGAKHIGAVYIEKDTPGVSFGSQENLMGFRGVPSSDIYFDNAEVPKENVVVAPGGFKSLMQAFDLERCGNATMALGQASGALEEILPYVQERRQFGKPIIDFQAVQLRVAEMQMRVEAARLLIYRAASNSQHELPSIVESSVAKCFANEIAREVTGSAMQLMGAYGYSQEFNAERRFRDAWGWGIAGGTIDIQKVNIASAMIGRRFDQRK
ncbi:acyl-CoA dehydrogenase family protein [Hyphococcus sp.]|uniref:acyl-CoA dehydrogenase family protein n=1 Tax=Hyphococcus sp. TaxID=2038636 RepID=UPI003CCBB4DA